MKYETLLPSAAATFIRLAIVGVMPLFSILWIGRRRQARALRELLRATSRARRARCATLPPSSETACSIDSTNGHAFTLR